MVHCQVCSVFTKINKYLRLNYTQHVQCIQKAFRPLYCSHILLCCNLLNWFNFFHRISLHSTQLNDDAETEVESSAQSEVLSTPDQVYIQDAFVLLLCSIFPQPKSMMLPPPCFSSTVQSWFHHTRESCFLQSAMKPRLVECLSVGCPSASLSDLHIRSLNLSQSDHQVLGHLSYPGPSPLVAQFSHAASSRKGPGCSKLLPLKHYGAFPRPVSPHNPVSVLCWQLL